jgi:branched-subunit amino acid ABC-type transport system permease component
VASFVGMGLVGVGGMLLGLDSSIDPLTGTRILLSIFAAAVLGGLGSAPGRGAGRLPDRHGRGAVGAGRRLAYRAAVGFFAILIMLSLRPRGLLGEAARL